MLDEKTNRECEHRRHISKYRSYWRYRNTTSKVLLLKTSKYRMKNVANTVIP